MGAASILTRTSVALSAAEEPATGALLSTANGGP